MAWNSSGLRLHVAMSMPVVGSGGLVELTAASGCVFEGKDSQL